MIHALRKLSSKILRCSILRLLYWFILIPLQWLLPKKKNSIVLIGKYGSFSDNVKYLFLYIHSLGRPDIEVHYVVKDKKLYNTLTAKGLPVLLHPTPQSLVTLIRAGIIVVAGNLSIFDSLCSSRAYKVQLWHGATMKKTGSLRKKQYGDNPLLYKLNKLVGFSGKWDLATSPSTFYSNHVFTQRFNPTAIIESGFPRNDCLLREIAPLELIGSDQQTIERIKAYKQQGCRIVLYAPTFRDTGGDALADGVVQLEDLNDFCERNHIVFIFKLHYKAKTTKPLPSLSHVWESDRRSDTYPMMGLADLLITDYSSIYMDYVLLDRPIVFFPYDYEKYTAKDREISFDYDWVTPGPKCRSQAELLTAIHEFLIAGNDRYQNKRREMADIGFTYKDEFAAKRVFDFLLQTIQKPACVTPPAATSNHTYPA